MLTIYAGNPGKHVKTVDIPEPVQVPSWPSPERKPVEKPQPLEPVTR